MKVSIQAKSKRRLGWITSFRATVLYADTKRIIVVQSNVIQIFTTRYGTERDQYNGADGLSKGMDFRIHPNSLRLVQGALKSACGVGMCTRCLAWERKGGGIPL